MDFIFAHSKLIKPDLTVLYETSIMNTMAGDFGKTLSCVKRRTCRD